MAEHAAVIVRPALRESFQAGWERGRVIYFSAPCGCGKTAAAHELLRGRTVCALDAAAADFAPESVPEHGEAVLIDGLQALDDTARQQALCMLIRARTRQRFVLLSRGGLPGWLMPFQLSGLLSVIGMDELMLDRAATQQMLEARGIAPDPGMLAAVQRDFSGYPLALEILCGRLARGAAYDVSVYDACRRDLFTYYHEAVFRRFDAPLRALLVNLAPFETFRLELARMVSGDSHAGRLLGELQRDTSMLVLDGAETYHFWPIFRAFLQWEMRQLLTERELRALYSRAGLFYELRDELDRALDCYAKAGEQERISALLVKNAEQHPGVGHYREMQDYYDSLPREEILRSPALMCGMSMLSAMRLDYEGSEQWYEELARCAARMKRGDPDQRGVTGKLAYLDIALPQRGSKGLIDVIGSVFRVMADKQLAVPSFSVTSMLPSIMNGGKDFCEWSRKDDLLYATMRRPVETVLGRDGVGLADCAICESKFEKGEDVSRRLLTLVARLGEIQARGTPDIEFAVVGLLARVQVSQGKARAARESILSLREKLAAAGETRFLGNIDALLCRIALRLGDLADAESWLRDRAPQNDVRLWAMWRYQYFTRVMVQFMQGEGGDGLLLLARLRPYCERCGRVMDGIHLRLLAALCREQIRDDEWRAELCAALDRCHTYQFVWPVAQYGAAILPLLGACGWTGDPDYLERLTTAARAQAVLYPRLFRRQSRVVEPLSAAETQVLRLLCENLSNQEIGEILDIKLATVKTHVSHILQKLGISRRSEAKAAAERLHLL